LLQNIIFLLSYVTPRGVAFKDIFYVVKYKILFAYLNFALPIDAEHFFVTRKIFEIFIKHTLK